MIFKKSFFIFFACFFISSCGLQVGEKSPRAPYYKLSGPLKICSQLNYKETFMNYFFQNKTVSTGINLALYCISNKIKEFRNLIGHNFLSRQQTVNIMNQNFIQESNFKPIVDKIMDPEYFYKYVSIKNSLIQSMSPNFEKNYLDSNETCPTSTNDSNVISKKDADVLIDFLTNLSDLFSSAEESALIIYSEFFSKKSINKLDIQNSNEVLKDFTIFLSDYFIDIFPNYAQFLKNQIDSDEAFLRKNMNPLLKILDQPFSEQTDITLSNVKNMTLSIYIVQHFFKNYDFNKDFYLSSHELKPFFCLVTPLVSIIILPQLKEEWQIIQSIYSPTEISNYIIYNQEFPSNNPVSRNFWNYLIYEADELVLLSYPEISKLISLLFLEFLYRIQVDED